ACLGHSRFGHAHDNYFRLGPAAPGGPCEFTPRGGVGDPGVGTAAALSGGVPAFLPGGTLPDPHRPAVLSANGTDDIARPIPTAATPAQVAAGFGRPGTLHDRAGNNLTGGVDWIAAAGRV